MNGSENNKNDSGQELNDEDKNVIIFALGRAYTWCQFNGVEYNAHIHKSKFLETAKKLGAQIKITEV
jgi:hypothetical protein